MGAMFHRFLVEPDQYLEADTDLDVAKFKSILVDIIYFNKHYI